MNPSPAEQQASNVLPLFGLGHSAELSAMTNQHGLSGARVWRAKLPDRSLVLRQWPPETKLDHVHFVHQAIRLAQNGAVPTPTLLNGPTGQTIMPSAGSLWELTSFLPGTAMQDWQPSQAAQAFTALAKLHQHWATRGERLSSFGIPHAIQLRQRLVTEATAADWLMEAERMATTTCLSPAMASELASLVRQQLPEMTEKITRYASFRCPVQLVHGDPRCEHFLFANQQLTGFVDFGAVRIDTPLVDLARLVGERMTCPLQTGQLGLHAYQQLVPLSAAELDCLQLLTHSGLLLSGYRWLKWLLLEKRSFGEPTQVIQRIEQIAKRIRAFQRFG